MPRLKEELQFPNTILNGRPTAPKGEGDVALFCENGVLKVIHSTNNGETALVETIKTSDDLDQTFQYSNYFTKAEVLQKLNELSAGLQFIIAADDSILEVIDPAAEEIQPFLNKLVLVPTSNGTAMNGYKEYLFDANNHQWEEIGKDDLSQYLTSAEFNRQKQEGFATIRDWTAQGE